MSELSGKEISRLAQHFLNLCCKVNGLPERSFTAEALQTLSTRAWSGQVADLMVIVEKAALKAEGVEVRSSDLVAFEQTSQALSIGQTGLSLAEMERRLIFQTLELTRQNKTRAADLLGISIRTLRNKLNEYREQGVMV